MNNGILQVFDEQRHRGTQGFGLFDGSKLHMVREKNEDKILKWLVRYDSNLILFHHRYPTSTVNVRRAAHPFSTRDYFDKEYVLVHNGMISNSDELKVEHEKLGITYYTQLPDGTFNDSEALLWDFALTKEGKQDKLKATGTIAFICIEKDDKELKKLHFARNEGNPLKLFQDKKGMALSSEGNGDDVQVNQLHTFDYKTKDMVQTYFYVPRYRAFTGTTQNSGFRGAPQYPYQDYRDTEWEEDMGYYTSKGDNACSPKPKSGLAKLGDILGNNVLARHVRNVENRKDFIDYDKDGNPIFGDEELDKLVSSITPTTTDVYDVALLYLDNSLGNFEQALGLLEDDYFDLAGEQELDEEVLLSMRTLEEAIKLIMSQEDYIKGEETSTLWIQSMQPTFV